jgi:hypothetical protein
MGVYRRTDAATYWMSLVIDGTRLRQDTGVQDRTCLRNRMDAPTHWNR